jgi:hypothetical protein
MIARLPPGWSGMKVVTSYTCGSVERREREEEGLGLELGLEEAQAPSVVLSAQRASHGLGKHWRRRRLPVCLRLWGPAVSPSQAPSLVPSQAPLSLSGPRPEGVCFCRLFERSGRRSSHPMSTCPPPASATRAGVYSTPCRVG